MTVARPLKSIALIVFSTFGLYGQWITGFYTAENGKEPPAKIPWSKFTHIIHNEAWPNSNGTLSDYIAPSETQQILASKPEGKSLLVQIGDNGRDSNAFGWATSPGTVVTFVSNIVHYVTSRGYDGVDVDWEVNTNQTRFVDLLLRLRSAMPDKVIAMDVYGPVVPVAAASYRVLDQINVMCYDMDLWSGYSWYNDALINGGSTNGSCSTRVGSVLNAGVPASKVGIGIPYYGRRWTGCTQPMMAGCRASAATTFFFRDLVNDPVRWQPQHQFYDTQYGSDYLSIPSLNEFDSYNGPRFMTDAAAWVKANALGGFMVFTQEYEYLPDQAGDAQYPLSTALYNAVFGAVTDAASVRVPARVSPAVKYSFYGGCGMLLAGALVTGWIRRGLVASAVPRGKQ
jgi:chitinase